MDNANILDAHVNVRCASCLSKDSMYVSADGELVCRNPTCDEPLALAQVLADDELYQHIVFVNMGGVTVKHPIIERLDDRLARCAVLPWAFETMEPHDGVYIAEWDDAAASWVAKPIDRDDSNDPS